MRALSLLLGLIILLLGCVQKDSGYSYSVSPQKSNGPEAIEIIDKEQFVMQREQERDEAIELNKGESEIALLDTVIEELSNDEGSQCRAAIFSPFGGWEITLSKNGYKLASADGDVTNTSDTNMLLLRKIIALRKAKICSNRGLCIKENGKGTYGDYTHTFINMDYYDLALPFPIKSNGFGYLNAFGMRFSSQKYRDFYYDEAAASGLCYDI